MTDVSSPLAGAISVDTIRDRLDTLRDQYEASTALLDQTLHAHEDIIRQVESLDHSRARLDPLVLLTRGLVQTKISDVAKTAGRISDAVERLDLEQARVKATLEVVDQVAELKACILGVSGSMGAPQDWEMAAEYLHRAAQISPSIIKSGFAEEIVPTAEVPDPPSITLHNAAQSLCDLFLREFDKAVQQSDGPRITRFFKMFPLIGRSEEGLGAYGRYVCQGVATRARASLQVNSARSNSCVNAMTKLFEHVAQVIDGHSALVERHYGNGTMIRVIERLHTETSVQGGIILDTWSDERHLDRILTDTRSYAFSFLIQSFLPAQRGTPRSQSPAVGATAPSRNEKDDTTDMKEIDNLLGDMVTMLSRWSLYLRFMALRTMEHDVNQDHAAAPLTSASFVTESSLPRKITKTLTDPFSVLATFFLRRSVEKAFQLDEPPGGLSLNLSKAIDANPPFITSAVDDVMYMVNQVVQRTLATSQAGLVVDVVSTTARILGSDFIGMIQRKMRDQSYPKATIQGAAPPEDKVIAFLVLNNNIDVAMAYIKRIVSSYLDIDSDSDANKLEELFPMDRDAQKVQKVMLSLQNNFESKGMELIGDGISVAFIHVVKPRLRLIIAEAFREMDNLIGDDQNSGQNLATDEGDDQEQSIVKRRFQSGWDQIMPAYKRILSEPNFARLLSAAVNYISKTLEKRLWSYQGRVSEVGAVLLERDVAEIAGIAVRGGSYKLREAFTRCLQIVTIMNMEQEEWAHLESALQNGEGEMWELTLAERQSARGLLKQKS